MQSKTIKLQLSPSKLERVECCPASALISALAREDDTSEAAKIGKLAHEFAEFLGRDRVLTLVYKAIVDSEKSFKEFVEDNFFSRDIPKDELLKHLTKDIADKCLNYVDFCNALGCDVDTYWIEQELDYTALANSTIPRRAVIDYLKLVEGENGEVSIYVVDFKFGKNPVFAKDNLQLIAYAVLAREFLQDEIKKIKNLSKVTTTLCIYAPNTKPEVDSITLSDEELEEYKKELLKITEKARAKDLELNPSKSGCLFCSGKKICVGHNEKAEQVLNIIKNDLLEQKIIKEYSNDELLELYSHFKAVKSYMELLTKEVEERFKEGKLEGLAFESSGRKTRFVEDIEGLVNHAESIGVSKENLFRINDIKPFTELEKILSKDVVNKYCSLKVGKPTIEVIKR